MNTKEEEMMKKVEMVVMMMREITRASGHCGREHWRRRSTGGGQWKLLVKGHVFTGGAAAKFVPDLRIY